MTDDTLEETLTDVPDADSEVSTEQPITVQHVQFTGPPAPFVPIRYPGPHLPQNSEAIVSALSLFELYFDDEVMGRIYT